MVNHTNSETASSAQRICLDGFHIYPTDELLPWLVYSNAADLHEQVGEEAGSILIRLGVDGESDQVLLDAGQSRDITVVSRSIERLQQVRDTLVASTPQGEASEGRCMMSGNWGRCKAMDSHGGDHEFPTHDDHRAYLAMCAPKVRQAS